MGRNSAHKINRPPRYSQPASVVHLEDEYDLFELIKRTSNPLILVLEGVQDPHNLGSFQRTKSIRDFGGANSSNCGPSSVSCNCMTSIHLRPKTSSLLRLVNWLNAGLHWQILPSEAMKTKASVALLTRVSRTLHSTLWDSCIPINTVTSY